MKIKYAIIGCGRISPNHIASAKNYEDSIEIVGICDINLENAKELDDKFSLNTNIYTDYNQMLKEQKPQLVAITTESGYHAKIALDCIEAGCNLIIEKPIALSLEDADEIIKKAKERGVFVCACHQNRFNKTVQKIREAVEAKRFGRLFHATAHIRWNRSKPYYDQAKWRGTWELDGGALMNQCIHNIDLLRWMMGDEIDEVFAYTDNLNHDFIDAEDLGIALIRFKNGAYGIIEGTTNVYDKNLEETLYIFGEKATVKAGGMSVNELEEWRFSDETEDANKIKLEFSEKPTNVYGFGHTPLYGDVISAIKEGRKPYVDAEAGRRALELVLAIYESSKTGKSVKLPLKTGSTLSFKKNFNNSKVSDKI